MNKTQSTNNLISRRAELLSELFLNDLGAQFVAQATTEDMGYDFLAGFPNTKGGINNIAVEVKATERLARKQYPIPRRQYERWIHSNIPILLLVVDAKENRLYFAWPSSKIPDFVADSHMVQVALAEVTADARVELVKRLTESMPEWNC